jgi:uncharacterized protein
MHDPKEGVTPQGTIRTGATAQAITDPYRQVLCAAIDAIADDVALYLYGSVATGTASVPASDVDLLSIGLPPHEAERISVELSGRFRVVCRDVSIGPVTWDAIERGGDEAYGLRVFLRHYGVHLHGPDPAEGLDDHPADARAARGFNGDIARYAEHWRSALEQGGDVARLGTRIARKTLLAVAGLVSVRDGTWTTDRRAAAVRWDEMEPDCSVGELATWLDTPPTGRASVGGALSGPVAFVAQRFESEIGLWRA